MRRRWVLALVVSALLAPSCGLVGDDGDGAAPEPVVPADTAVLRVASAPWPACLNPVTCADPAARWLVWEHVLPKLVEVDADGQLVPSPVLAGMPEVRVDEATGRQTITYVIDQAARWHDGRPITSSDLTGTWLAHRSTPGSIGPYDRIVDIDDGDPLVARVTLDRPFADWTELFGGQGGWLLQADALSGRLDVTGRFEDRLPFGAGPFELVSAGGSTIVLAARDEHWATGRQPAVEQVRIRRMPADDPGAVADLGPDIDLAIPGALPADATGRFAVAGRPTTEAVGVFLDRRTPALGSRAVRRAVEVGLDRGALAARLSVTGAAIPCVGPVPPEAACTDRGRDTGARPDEARELLDGDGWTAGPTGVRSRAGVPLLVPVSYDPTLPGAERAAAAVVDALAPLGFATVLQATDERTWLAGDRSGSTGIGMFSVDLATVESVAALHRCEPGAVNPMGWCDPANQAVARTLAATTSPSARLEVVTELAQLAGEETSWLPLTQQAMALLVDGDRAQVPPRVPPGSGPLGRLDRFARVDG